jgi:hypothetical protein
MTEDNIWKLLTTAKTTFTSRSTLLTREKKYLETEPPEASPNPMIPSIHTDKFIVFFMFLI